MMLTHDFYLVIREGARSPYLRATIHSKLPKVPAGAVLMELRLSIPNNLFRKPVLRASVALPENELSNRITADVADTLGKELSRHVGVRVEVVPYTPAEES